MFGNHSYTYIILSIICLYSKFQISFYCRYIRRNLSKQWASLANGTISKLDLPKIYRSSAWIRINQQYNQPSRQTIIDGHEAELVDNEKDIRWIILKPSVIIKSPAIWKSEDNYYRIWIQTEPGLSFACPFRNSLTYGIKEFSGIISHTVDYRTFPNKGLQWLYWNAKISINLAFERFIFRGGYYISNLDYYSGRRNITLANRNKFWVPQKELSQSIFLSIGYTFQHF